MLFLYYDVKVVIFLYIFVFNMILMFFILCLKFFIKFNFGVKMYNIVYSFKLGFFNFKFIYSLVELF